MVLDLIEVFAGTARLTDLAHKYGLSASQPFDIKYGIDLKTKAGRDMLKRAVRTLKPLLLLVAWPCTVWNIFNRNMNYSYRLDELESLREEDRPLVKLGVELCYEQIEGGRFYLGENPLRSDLWKESHVQQLRQHADNIEVTGDAGAYGAENRDGWPIQKPHRWITNSKILAENLSKKMTPEQKLFTKPVEGKDTAPSGEYCDGLVNAILTGLHEEAHALNPQRFHVQQTSSKVLHVKPFNDEEAWKDILDEAERRFANTYKRPIILGEADELMPKIQQLVPWEISRVQLAWTPAARRWPIDVSFTHRGCALRTMPGAFRLEHEDENSVKYPNQRFTESIRVGIFFYGFAGDEEEERKFDEDIGTGGQSKRVIGVSTDITFEGGPPMSREMQASVARLHCNLGHPPKQEIVRILAAAGKLDSKILAALDALRCGSCIRMSKTVKPTTSSTSAAVKYSGAFGDHLQSDIIFIRLLTGEAVPVLGMICMSTNYHAATVLDSRIPDHVLDKMIEIWYKPLGLPISITVDADTCYQAKTQAWHQNLGIEYDIIPTEEAWRLGKIGKRNALMRTLAERLIDQNAAVTRKQLDEILVSVVFSMNSSTYTYGRSPYQAVFGRIPRPVGDILSDSKALTISTQPHPEQHSLQPEILRAEALSALAQFTASQAVKRAMLRKTRNQNDLSQLLPGQTVAFWRMSGKSRQHKKGSWNLARFLAFDPDRKSCWLQVGKTSIRVGTTQLRPAAGWENWTPSNEDLRIIKQAENNASAGLWLEEAGEGPQPDDEMIADELFKFPPAKWRRTEERPQLEAEQRPAQAEYGLQAEQRPAEAVDEDMAPFTLATLPASAVRQPDDPDHRTQINMEQQQLNQQLTQNNITHDNRQITVHVDSPTYQAFGQQVNFGPVPPTPRRAARSRSPPIARPSSLPPQSSATQLMLEPETPVPEEMRQLQLTQVPPMPSQPADVLLTIYDDCTADYKAKHWDGSPTLTNPHFHNQVAYQAYLQSEKRIQDMKGISEPERPDWDVSDEEDGDLEISNERNLTRQEIKQLDRELPWREVVAMPAMMQDKFIQSADKEYQGWMRWTGIRPLTESEANEVWSSPTLRKRILRSRAAYKDKSRGLGELRAKTRVVLVGCGDPDLRQLTRDSPTPSRLSEFLVLSIATAGANRMFHNQPHRWYLWLSDAAQAFLQGRQDPSERSGPIFMQPPRDPIIEAAGAYPASLYEVTGNCYGLANAPRVWFNKVCQELFKASFQQHTFDRCLFYHRGLDGALDCILIVHVDDFMATYSEVFDVKILEELFEWGSITRVDENHPGEYRGKEVKMKETNGKITLHVTQQKFLDNLTNGKIPVGRLQKEPQLSAEEWKEMRSVCGCLQWLGGQTRPDVAATASLSHRGGDTEITDLKRLHETLKYAKETASSGITFPAIPVNKASVIVTFADSSWANAAKHSSQFGVMLVLCPPQVTEVISNCHVLDWKSGRSARICRSTLAAEACAADEGNDRACYINMVMTELLHKQPAYKGEMRLRALHTTDAKSLYDALVAENLSLSEKRATMNIRSIQQVLTPAQIHWLPTTLMVADGLTKHDLKLQDSLRQWCNMPKVQLRDDKSKKG